MLYSCERDDVRPEASSPTNEQEQLSAQQRPMGQQQTIGRSQLPPRKSLHA